MAAPAPSIAMLANVPPSKQAFRQARAETCGVHRVIPSFVPSGNPGRSPSENFSRWAVIGIDDGRPPIRGCHDA